MWLGVPFVLVKTMTWRASSKVKGKKKTKPLHQTSSPSVLGFEFGRLQEEIKIHLGLQTVSPFSAAQMQDANLK